MEGSKEKAGQKAEEKRWFIQKREEAQKGEKEEEEEGANRFGLRTMVQKNGHEPLHLEGEAES